MAVDSAAFERLGGRQPIPREYLARVVRGLSRCGASVVGIDITFASPTEPRADAALAEAIREFSDHGVSRVVLLGPLSAGAEPLGAAALGASVLTASPLVSVPRDGVIRRVDPLLPGPDGTTEPTLALALVARQQGLDRRALDARLASGQLRGVTLERDAGWPINYVGPAGSFFTISSDQLAALGDAGAEAPAADNPFRGRIVLVGGTFPEGRDTYQTPYGPMPGVEVHANVAHMLTTGRFIRPSSWWVGLAVNVAVSLVAGVVLLTPAAADRHAGLRRRRAGHRRARRLLRLQPRRLLDRLRAAGGGHHADRTGRRRAGPAAVPRLVRPLPLARRDGAGADRRAQPARRAPRGVDPVLRPARLHHAVGAAGHPSGSPPTSTSTSTR